MPGDPQAWAGTPATADEPAFIRLTSVRRPPVLSRFPGGSVLPVTGGVQVRIITASVTVTCHDGTSYGGTSYGGSYRLATTVPDWRAYPADALIAFDHERWEHEITYLALRHTLLPGRARRSHDPAGLEQEIWALQALVPGTADRGHRRRPDPPGHRLRPGQLPDRRRNRPDAGHQRHQRHPPDAGPGRRHRQGRPGQPARPAPPPRLRPHGQIPARPLGHAPARVGVGRSTGIGPTTRRNWRPRCTTCCADGSPDTGT